MTILPPNFAGLSTEPIGAPHILLIEPDPGDAKAITESLNAYFGEYVVEHLPGMDLIADGDRVDHRLDGYHIAICSMDAYDQGANLVEELLLIRPDLPIIMTAGSHSQIDAARVMRDGAYDYVLKIEGFCYSLPAIIEKNLALYQVRQENARLQVQLTATLGQLRTKNEQLQGLVNELKAIAATDALTGIANRRALSQALDQRYAHAVRHDGELSVIAIDLDGFKKLNDHAGHAAGDRALMLVARVMTANARASDVPGRIGGDEFVVVLPETDTCAAMKVAERIRADFDLGFAGLSEKVGYPDRVTISAGVATRRGEGIATGTASGLLAAADRALYRAKQAGRSRIVVDNCAG